MTLDEFIQREVDSGRIEDAERIYNEIDCFDLIKESYEKRDVKHFFFGKEV